MTRTRILFLLLTIALGSSADAGEFWQEKDYRRWSEKECKKMLEDSPWARRYSLGRVVIELIDPARQPEGVERGRESNPRLEYQVQFRSALPIRRALVRLSQISEKYDRMSPEQQRAFDEDAEKFLGARFPDLAALYVSYSSNVRAYDADLARHWQTQTTETLKNFMFLIGSVGERVRLAHYEVAQGGGRHFQLLFPRVHKGRPLVGPQDKTLQLEFLHPNIRGQGESRVLIEFKVAKMLIDGAVGY